MRNYALVAWVATGAALAINSTTSLADICTTSYVTSVLPIISGITIDATSVTTNAIYNAVSTSQNSFPDSTYNYCEVNFAYSHDGTSDRVQVVYWMPAPGSFKDRYQTQGGAGYATTLPNTRGAGVSYGAATGGTDGGFGSFSTNFDAVALNADGSGINQDLLSMFAYQGAGECTEIGKAFTSNFYAMGNKKLYTYYQGCSEGGRSAWSQAQHYGNMYDGIIIGAPAMRYGQQQVLHLYSNVVEHTLNYYPPPCELQLIRSEIISNCDSLDGKVDGVISRSDLCLLNFNINATLGMPYDCYSNNQGNVSAEGIALAQKILDGIYDSDGKRAWISYQPGGAWDDATTTYDWNANSWGLSIASKAGEWIARFLEEKIGATNLDNLDNVTYDTVRDWMSQGMWKFPDLQTNNPNLTTMRDSGGKILVYHGEADSSVPTGSSVHFHESIRNFMYPGLSLDDSNAQLSDFLQLYLVPGAAHCAPSGDQANGPYPQTNMGVMIDWVENGVTPITLNATHLGGDSLGANAQLCQWPKRPLWTDNGATQTCVFDEASYQTWIYDIDAYKPGLTDPLY
jgi:tannase